MTSTGLFLPSPVWGPPDLTCIQPFRSTSYTWWTCKLLGCSATWPTRFFREHRTPTYLFSLQQQTYVTLHSHLPPVFALIVHFVLHRLIVKLEFQQKSVTNQYPFLGLFNGSLCPYARPRYISPNSPSAGWHQQLPMPSLLPKYIRHRNFARLHFQFRHCLNILVRRWRVHQAPSLDATRWPPFLSPLMHPPRIIRGE